MGAFYSNLASLSLMYGGLLSDWVLKPLGSKAKAGWSVEEGRWHWRDRDGVHTHRNMGSLCGDFLFDFWALGAAYHRTVARHPEMNGDPTRHILVRDDRMVMSRS